MAIIKNGILGGFSGKAGAVIGYRCGGQDVMRGRPRERTIPATKGEKANQEKFAYVQAWLQPLLPFVRVGFQGYAPNYQGFVAAKSYNLKNAVIGSSPYFQIDPAKALVSYGDMHQTAYATAIAEEQDYLTFRWDGDHFEYNDRVMLLAYDMTGEIASFNTCAERARAGSARLSLYEGLRDKHVDVYLAFISEDRTRRSTSQYLGLIRTL